MNDDLPLTKALLAGSAALKSLCAEDLTPFSVEDLSERIEHLQREIDRAQQARDKKGSSRQAADALFSFKGS